MPGNYNATGQEPTCGGGVAPFPAGDYILEIIAAEEGKTQKGDQKVTVNSKVVTGEHAEREVRFHTITFLPAGTPGAGMALHFLKSIGEPFEGDFKWDEMRWLGRRFKGSVTITQDNKGRDWNRVDSVLDTPEDIVEYNKKCEERANEEVPF